MKFLVDTNIIIPLEPTSKLDLEVNTDLALEFHNLINKSGNSVFIHPSIKHDIARDRDADRQSLRKKLIHRYPSLESPPSTETLDPSVIKPEEFGSNAWVDNSLIAALQSDLADYLVTEDVGIHKKAKRLALDARVLLLGDAITLIKDLFDITPAPPPSVTDEFVYELDPRDPIFDSLKEDYNDFDNWLEKCRREHRKAFVVRNQQGAIAGLVILKQEDKLPDGIKGKVLKICTFKVSESHGGNRLGELLLKPVFEYVKENRYEYAYFTAYPKQTHLISFANEFGFQEITNDISPNELALCKVFSFQQEDHEKLKPLDFHIKYGPLVTSFNGNKSFVIPIRPNFHQALFPELGPIPRDLFSTPLKPCGNSIRKAYLSKSKAKKITVGDNIFFYRSKDIKALTCVGIVEGVMRSQEPSEIARTVGKRTVYSFSAIESLCSKNEVLAILFRYVGPFSKRINLTTLVENGILKAQPQSITQLSESNIEWIKQQIKM